MAIRVPIYGFSKLSYIVLFLTLGHDCFWFLAHRSNASLHFQILYNIPEVLSDISRYDIYRLHPAPTVPPVRLWSPVAGAKDGKHRNRKLPWAP